MLRISVNSRFVSCMVSQFKGSSSFRHQLPETVIRGQKDSALVTHKGYGVNIKGELSTEKSINHMDGQQAEFHCLFYCAGSNPRENKCTVITQTQVS